MKRYGKKYQAAIKLIDKNKVYSIEEACKLVKQTSTVKFDATVDVSFRFNEIKHQYKESRSTN